MLKIHSNEGNHRITRNVLYWYHVDNSIGPIQLVASHRKRWFIGFLMVFSLRCLDASDPDNLKGASGVVYRESAAVCQLANQPTIQHYDTSSPFH